MFFTSAMLLVAVVSCIGTIWFIMNHLVPFQFNSLFKPKAPADIELKLPSQKVKDFQEWLNRDIITSYREKAERADQWMTEEIHKARKSTDENVKTLDESMRRNFDHSIDYIKEKAGEMKDRLKQIRGRGQ